MTSRGPFQPLSCLDSGILWPTTCIGPALGRGFGTRGCLRSLWTQSILWSWLWLCFLIMMMIGAFCFAIWNPVEISTLGMMPKTSSQQLSGLPWGEACSRGTAAIISTFDREMSRRLFHFPFEGFCCYSPSPVCWSLSPLCILCFWGFSGTSQLQKDVLFSPLETMEWVFLSCSQSVCLILLGGSGWIPLTASCQTALSENAPPSLGCSLLFQPLLIRTYIAAKIEVDAQHINSLRTGEVRGLNSAFCSSENAKLWNLTIFFWVVSLESK